MSEETPECCCINIPSKLSYDEHGVCINKCTPYDKTNDYCSFCKEIYTIHNPPSGFAFNNPESPCICETKVHLKCLLLISNLTAGIFKKYASKIKCCRKCTNSAYGKTVRLNSTVTYKLEKESNWLPWTPYYYGADTMNYEIVTYNNTNKHGIAETWYLPIDDTYITRPTIMRKNMYKNNVKHGQMIEYAQQNYPYPKAIYNLSNGQYHGDYIIYYEGNSKVPKWSMSKKTQYTNGHKNGVEQEYDLTFKDTVYLKREYTYSRGTLNGLYREWYCDKYDTKETYLIDEKRFLAGNFDLAFPMREWHSAKQLKSEIVFVNEITIDRKPVVIIHKKEWHANGRIKFEGNQYINNRGVYSSYQDIEFPSIRYHANGSIESRKTLIESVVDSDVPVDAARTEEESKDEEEEELHAIISSNEGIGGVGLKDNTLIQIEEFYSDGSKSYLYYKIWSAKDQSASIHGTFMSWHKNGNLREIINYYKGAREGNYVKYNASGHILKMGVYDITGENHRIM